MTDCITMIKYQGLGNDYLVLDPNKNRVQLQGKKIALMCQRGFGLGADGVLYGPVDINGKMGVHIYNSDGSEAAISGNGVCIFAKYLMDNEYVTEKKFAIETLSGTIEVECLNARATEFRVNMGKASFLSREIPVTGEVREVINEPFTFNKKEYKATCLTVVQAYEGSQQAEVVLEHGSVRLQTPAGVNLVTLQPDQRALYDAADDNLAITQVNASHLVLTQYDLVTMSDATLHEIISHIETTFGVRLSVPGRYGDKRYTFNYQRSNSLEEVLNIVEYLTGEHCEVIYRKK